MSPTPLLMLSPRVKDMEPTTKEPPETRGCLNVQCGASCNFSGCGLGEVERWNPMLHNLLKAAMSSFLDLSNLTI